MNEKLLKALIAAGLAPGLAATFASISKDVKDEEIESTVKLIVDGSASNVSQAEIDRRVTQGVKTAIENYEKKYNLKEGKTLDAPIVDPPKVDPPLTGIKEDPQIAELKKIVLELTNGFKGLQQKSAAEERNSKIKRALSDAKIPENLQKYFNVKEEATDEEISQAVTEYRQEMFNAGIASLSEPGSGKSGGEKEVLNAKLAAERKNNSQSVDTVGVVPPMKIG